MNKISALCREMLDLDSQLDDVMTGLPTERQQELKAPITEMAVSALTLQEPDAQAFCRIIETLRATIAMVKRDELMH